jgi:hypothetical protein
MIEDGIKAGSMANTFMGDIVLDFIMGGNLI